MKVCVIGAGAAGCCAVRYAVSFKCDVIAFEQSEVIGGTWVYSDDIQTDKFSNEIHSSMYKNLSTNLPKEIMQFPDFPFPSQTNSYIRAKNVNDYLNSYANHYDLRRFIKFSHYVVRVRPIFNGGQWEVIVRNLLTTTGYETFLFDAVLVCNGHFTTPIYPKFDGENVFQGQQSHSHEYREPEKFKNRRVLVVGGGPSGVDISQDIAKCGAQIFWSHHQQTMKNIQFENVTQKPDVHRLVENGVEFADGTFELIDDIVYCTGYKYTFPFLSVDCGLATDESYVRNLYKHCINIDFPSLAVIGLNQQVCPFQLFDLQVRFCLTFMTAQKPLPSRDEMMADTERDMSERWKRGLPKKKAHSLGKLYQETYFHDLAITAQVDPIKPVILKIYNEVSHHKIIDFQNYRNYNFTVIDDENFVFQKVIE